MPAKTNPPQETRSQVIGTALNKTGRMSLAVLPILTGMLLLIGAAVTLLPQRISAAIFTGNPLWDALKGSALGSVAAGMPVFSYVLGKGLVDAGVGMTTVTALILSWVTVGMVQLPAESLLLGHRFALVRNAVSFILAVFAALLVSWTMRLLA